MIALLEAFYRPTEGTIEYHGVDLKEINVRWFRGELGLVSQEATLFSTTIEENIRYGRPEATMEQVIEAAKEANCHDFIVAFPDGYKTQIGEGGSLVSGGQVCSREFCLGHSQFSYFSHDYLCVFDR